MLTPDDSVKADSAKGRKDTVLTVFAESEMPTVIEIGESYTWDRAALFNTGGLTLNDVLERVAGLTTFRSGWINSPQYIAYLGNPGRVRIFWDGTEMVAMGNSTSYPLDLASVPIWSIQDMTVERGADELRIYIRSWSVTRTITQSRVDIVTGDLGLNILRGYFGTRFVNGFGVQFGGQVFGTANNVLVGSGTGSDLLGRIGWGHGLFSIDLYAQRQNGTRDPQLATTYPAYLNPALTNGIPGQSGYRSNTYLRAGLGQPDSGRWWAQVVLSDQQVSQQLARSILIPYLPLDSTRVQQSAKQLILAGGLMAGPFKISGSGRYKWLPLGTSEEVTGRASLATKLVLFSAYVDYVADSGGITDLALKLSPTSWLALEGGVGYRIAPSAQGGDGVSARISIGARLGRVWISGGAMERAATVVPGLVLYDTAYHSAASASTTGPFLALRGKVVDDLGINFWAVRWDAAGFYRPLTQARAEVFLDTEWRSQFPSGHFGLKATFGSEYRSDVLFPTATATEVIDPTSVIATASNVIYTNIQVRVLDATLYFTATWALDPRPYEWVPQYVQEVQVFTYGLRWSFWN